MGWLTPVGKSKTTCACGGVVKPGGRIPLKRNMDVAYQFTRCQECNTGWTNADPGTEYRLFKVDGQWRARPI